MVDMHPQTPDEITPEWLTMVLKESGFLVDSKVLSVKKKPIGEGKAWLSKILRLEVKYSPSLSKLPKSFVLKMLSKSDYRDPEYELGAYRREINFYQQLAPTLPIRLPRLYYSVTGVNCNLMLMEDLGHMAAGDLIDGMEHGLVLSTLEQLAKVHAAYWDSSKLDSLDWIPRTNNLDTDYIENWDSFVGLCGDFIDPEAIKIGEKLKSNIEWLSGEIGSRPHTLIHDDMKADNLLFGDLSTEVAVAILDWQFPILSMGTIDVARLIGGSMLPEERSGFHFEALRFWYDKLLEYGVQEYSWEEAQRDFKLGALYCLTFPVYFHKGITRAEGRALEYVKAFYSRLFLFVLEIDDESVFP